jgi:hypothetical protein
MNCDPAIGGTGSGTAEHQFSAEFGRTPLKS